MSALSSDESERERRGGLLGFEMRLSFLALDRKKSSIQSSPHCVSSEYMPPSFLSCSLCATHSDNPA